MDKPRITALNKIDLLLGSDKTWDEASAISYLSNQCEVTDENMVLVSATKRWGLNKLLELINQVLIKVCQPA
jgi:50S ribosomal subunit-associated GTPase HflX